MNNEENCVSVFEEFIQLCEDKNLFVTLSHGNNAFGYINNMWMIQVGTAHKMLYVTCAFDGGLKGILADAVEKMRKRLETINNW